MHLAATFNRVYHCSSSCRRAWSQWKKDASRTIYTFNATIFRVKQGECVYEEPHILGSQSDVEGRRVDLYQRCTAFPTPTAVLGERDLEPGVWVGGKGSGGARKLRVADKRNNIAEFIGQTILQNERWEEDQTGEDT